MTELNKPLLIELGCEELPAASINPMSAYLGEQLHKRLADAGFKPGKLTLYATPRRLAAYIDHVNEYQPDQEQVRRGPAIKAAYDAEGNPTKAAIGFAASCGIDIKDAQTLKTDKGEWLLHAVVEKGASLSDWLQPNLAEIMAKMPMPKRMRWADHDFTFLRPVEWLVALHGSFVVPCELFALTASQKTYVHRFHHPEPVSLMSAEEYEESLLQGFVIASSAKRREKIIELVKAEAVALGGQAVITDALVDEVSCLVEWPTAISGHFAPEYLEAPKEALILTMQDDQRYFAMLDENNELMPSFITISNIESESPETVRSGNERVVNPRLADAMFFWQQDQKIPLGSLLPGLKKVTFQEKLGSVHDKVERMVRIARFVARQLEIDAVLVERAARLSKCDLQTSLVFEFPELQGIAGKYYIQKEGESVAVAEALEQQYWPKQAGDATPDGPIGQVLAIADKTDTLAGIFGIGQKPTGTKDPFALRRASLGLIRIIIERQLPLDLNELLSETQSILSDRLDKPEQVMDAFDYISDRYDAYYRDQGISPQAIESVKVLRLTRPLDFDRRLRAVTAFQALPEARSLAEANKRAQNILKKVEGEISQDIDTALLSDQSEIKLYEQIQKVRPEVNRAIQKGDYQTALKQLAGLREPVDTFFVEVMVMADDEQVKNNRLALLKNLASLCGSVADISCLRGS